MLIIEHMLFWIDKYKYIDISKKVTYFLDHKICHDPSG